MDKKVIITGATGLIGRCMAELFVQDGYEVVPVDISLGHDLRDEGFVKHFFEENSAPYLLNLFAYNDHVSGDTQTNNLFDITLESFDKFLNVNLTALFSVCREYARNNSEGSIINVSSLYSRISPDPALYKSSSDCKKEKHIAYGVSKAGVEQLTRHLAVHLAPNIRVNCVAPGGVGEDSQPQSFVTKFSNKTAAGRMMTTDELFGVFRYLCSPHSSYTTGTTIRVNGGYGCR